VSGQTDSIVDIVKERRSIIQSIADGIFDGAEDDLFEAVKRRRRIVDLTLITKLAPGDTVKFNETANPKYLKGVKASVTEVKTTTVRVQMPDMIAGDTGGRFEGMIVSCPVSILDKVDDDA